MRTVKSEERRVKKHPAWQIVPCTLYLALVFLLTSCEHRELVDLHEEIAGEHYVRIYMNEHLRNVTYGFYDETKEKPEYSTPKAIRVTLSDPNTGEVVAERYLTESGSDERGNYLHGHIVAQPGTYHLLAYNYDTQSTHIYGEYSYPDMEVYTNPVKEPLKDYLQGVRSPEVTRAEEIRYEPDHVFVASIEGATLKHNLEGDTLRTEEGDYPTAHSVTKTYYLQINVKGVEYVNSAVALITGMSGAVRLHNRAMVPEKASSIYFNMKNGVNRMRTSENVSVAYASFNTFGKLPDTEGYIEITFGFNTTGGGTQTETIRVTDLFETPEVSDRQWIIIDKTIEIEKPENFNGGMSPGVTQWEEIESDFTIR